MGHAMSVQKSGAATSGKGLQVKLTNVDLWRGFKLCEHFIRVSRLQAVRIPLKKKGSSSLDAGGVPKLFGLQPTLNNMTVWMRDTFLYVGVLRVLWLNHGGGGQCEEMVFFIKKNGGYVAFTCIYMPWNSRTLPNVLKGELAYNIRKVERMEANMMTKNINHWLRNSHQRGTLSYIQPTKLSKLAKYWNDLHKYLYIYIYI